MPKERKSNRKIDDATKQAAWDEMIQMTLRGASHREVARTLGFHANTISKWAQDPDYQIQHMRHKSLIFNKTEDAASKAAKDAYEDIRAKIDRYAGEAIEHIHTLMKQAESESVQLNAAKDMADRSPETQKTQKVDTTSRVMLFTPDMLVLAMQTAKTRIGGLPVPAIETNESPIDVNTDDLIVTDDSGD